RATDVQMIDATHVKAHRSASGAKRMARPVDKWFCDAGMNSLHKRIRPFGDAAIFSTHSGRQIPASATQAVGRVFCGCDSNRNRLSRCCLLTMRKNLMLCELAHRPLRLTGPKYSGK
ncbi:MAG: hypothetical protein P8Y71_29555, partial [Pseudolabrys sp.]